MKKKWVLIILLVSVNLFAAANIPVQRIDIVNMLSTTAVTTQTEVLLAFDNGQTIPCFSTRLPFHNSVTVWAGIGQTCEGSIIGVTITPLPVADGSGVVYEEPIEFSINGRLYSTQISINQGIAPIFDPGNGAVVTPGTIQVNLISNLGGSKN